MRVVVLTEKTEELLGEHKQCECRAYICMANVTFKSTNASPFNLFCRDSVQEIVLEQLAEPMASDEAQQLSGLRLNESTECFLRRSY